MSLAASSAALSRLEPFLLLARSARGQGAAKLVLEATAAPGTYVFSELLEALSVAELSKSPELEPYHRLLSIFAFGTIDDVASAPSGSLPPLSDAHLAKLRQLSLVSLCSKTRAPAYAAIVSALHLDLRSSAQSSAAGPSQSATIVGADGIVSAKGVRAIEDIIIDAMYAGIISGRLDQRKQRFEVEGVLGRDVRGDEEIASLHQELAEWSQVTQNLLHDLTSRIKSVQEDEARSTARKNDHDHATLQVLEHIVAFPQSGGGGGGEGPPWKSSGRGGAGGWAYDKVGGDRGHAMDLDDDDGERSRRRTGAATRNKRTRA